MDFLTDLESCVPSLALRAGAAPPPGRRGRPGPGLPGAGHRPAPPVVRRVELRPWLFRDHAQPPRHPGSGPAAPGPRRNRSTRPSAPRKAAERLVALREMEEALACLSDEQREVVLMVALTGMSYKTAPRPWGCRSAAGMSRLARGRERLRQMLEGMETPARAEPLLRRVK